MSEEIINVMIVDDISSLCTRYEGILSQAEDIRVVAVANNGYEAILKSAVTQPDVILMDIEMESKYAGITATQQILAQFPDMKVVILTVYDEDAMIYAAFQAGACDYIQKTATPAMMLQCVRDAYHERSVMKPTVARKIRTEFKRIKDNEDSLIYTLYLVQLLTDTERDILYAFHSGMTQKEICQARYIEPSTMKTHMRNILHKMKCRKMEDVLKKAESCGFFYYMDKIREKQQQG
ncbi:response regulator transcription factor [uncultured Subdoligranulum sp.]|uniref:response regulator transcription factor n=1 Tax=uncultured Subdoligranulum sp. TaxID=512298 RepID=UPI0025F8C1D7|nr:response regulator transcription factor [uncultured Subdoligranulum sp.]